MIKLFVIAGARFLLIHSSDRQYNGSNQTRFATQSHKFFYDCSTISDRL